MTHSNWDPSGLNRSPKAELDQQREVLPCKRLKNQTVKRVGRDHQLTWVLYRITLQHQTVYLYSSGLVSLVKASFVRGSFQKQGLVPLNHAQLTKGPSNRNESCCLHGVGRSWKTGTESGSKGFPERCKARDFLRSWS